MEFIPRPPPRKRTVSMNTRYAFLPLFLSLLARAALAQVPLNPIPTRIVGQAQLRLTSASPNLVEARDLANPQSVAVDTSVSPPLLYVADTGNNRVLGWRDASAFSNGAPADLVIGQRDFFTTTAQGPGTALTTGLFAPMALAVDAQGNLYVADAGNNRILRYPRPFAQSEELRFPDKVIGQATFNDNRPNAGGAAPTARTLSLNQGGGRIFRTSMVFDQEGNLWVSDGGNNRVLRYAREELQRAGHQPPADTVLGQFAFETSAATTDSRNKLALNAPRGLALDNANRLYVADALGRVLVYVNPRTGAAATRIMGVVVVPPGGTPPPDVNESSLGRIVNQRIVPCEGIFFAAGTPFVIDSPANRIVRYDPFESWPPEATAFSPPGRVFIGQPDANSFRPNRGQAEPSNSGFNNPVAAAVAGNEVFVADAGNNRVLVFNLQNFTTAVRVLGQREYYQSAPNNIDGREFYLFNGFTQISQSGVSGIISAGAGLVVDTRSSPPRLYVSDTFNHRVLGFKDARNVRPADKADLVIGQRDFLRSLINNPTNDPNQLTDSGLYFPAGLAVDDAGNLYVADQGNGRVLRFPRPFDQQGDLRPDLVLGQASFFVKITDPTARTMGQPYGLALTREGHLVVSDGLHNRVLFFRKPAGGDFTSGQAAEKVFGQPDFSSSSGSNAPTRMISPRGVAVDSEDRLYVADPVNNRIFIYDRISSADADPAPAFVLQSVGSPHGIFVSLETGELWVAEASRGRAVRYPRFDRLVFSPAPEFVVNLVPGIAPLAVALDAFGNLLIAETSNRVSLYFARLQASNAGNGLYRFAPGMYATLKTVENSRFTDTTLVFDQIPNPVPMTRLLADIEVLVNDVASPLHFVSPGQINFFIPKSTPSSGEVDVIVQRRSTGQILGATTIPMSPYAPALFTVSGDGTGQVAALNQDQTLNSPSSRAGRGEFISLFGTGQGVVPGMPDDGAPAGAGLRTNAELRVLIGTDFVPPENIQYSGLVPGAIGLWQINVKIPDRVPPDPNVPVVLTLNSIPSNQDSTGRRVLTTIAVKP